MKRDPLWTAIQVFVGSLGALLALGLCRLVLAAIEWVGL